jgi:hypothetical protein
MIGLLLNDSEDDPKVSHQRRVRVNLFAFSNHGDSGEKYGRFH